MDENVDVELLKKKVNHFATEKTPVHITMKKGYWRNGIITEESADFFMLRDLKAKITDRDDPIFYLEIFDLRQYQEDEK
jgi:hypothetical protein